MLTHDCTLGEIGRFQLKLMGRRAALTCTLCTVAVCLSLCGKIGIGQYLNIKCC